MSKLTKKEKALIECVLNYEKGYRMTAQGVAKVFGLYDMDSEDLIPFGVLAESLGLDTSDRACEIIFGYTNGNRPIDETLALIESFIPEASAIE